MSQDILIACGSISIIERSENDITCLPDYGNGATLIAEADWTAFVEDAGSEAALLKTLGITEDLRNVVGEL